MNMMRDSFWASRLFRRWRKTKSEPSPPDSRTNFSALLRIFRQDGWVYLELLLINRSDVTIWVKEATVVLSELKANWQTTTSSGQVKHDILQNIGPDDTLRVSIARDIYDAAGRPQGNYSCLVSIKVCYRLDNEWFIQKLDTYRVEMAALTVFRLRREAQG